MLAVPTERARSLLSGGRRALTDALKAALADTVERVALPRRFRFVDELPLTAEGKTTDALVIAALAPMAPQPTWLEREPCRARLSFEIDASLRVLQGHFPQAAIVPGVAQVDWAIGWIAGAFSSTTRVERIDALKFQALMRPGNRVTLELEWSPERFTASFRYQGPDGTPFSSGRVVFSQS